MRNAQQHAKHFDILFQGQETSRGNGEKLLEKAFTEVMLDVMNECQEIAKRVLQSPRTEILKMQPQDAKLMTPHDCWVKAADAIIKNIEQLKRAQFLNS